MFLVWKKHAFDVLLFHISISILFYHTNGILNVTYVPYGTIPEEYATNLTSSDESYIATNSYKITSQNFTTSEDPTPYDYVGLIQCADYFYVPNDTSCIPYKVSFIVTRSQNDMAPNITYIGIYENSQYDEGPSENGSLYSINLEGPYEGWLEYPPFTQTTSYYIQQNMTEDNAQSIASKVFSSSSSSSSSSSGNVDYFVIGPGKYWVSTFVDLPRDFSIQNNKVLENRLYWYMSPFEYNDTEQVPLFGDYDQYYYIRDPSNLLGAGFYFWTSGYYANTYFGYSNTDYRRLGFYVKMMCNYSVYEGGDGDYNQNQTNQPTIEPTTVSTDTPSHMQYPTQQQSPSSPINLFPSLPPFQQPTLFVEPTAVSQPSRSATSEEPSASPTANDIITSSPVENTELPSFSPTVSHWKEPISTTIPPSIHPTIPKIQNNTTSNNDTGETKNYPTGKQDKDVIYFTYSIIGVLVIFIIVLILIVIKRTSKRHKMVAAMIPCIKGSCGDEKKGVPDYIMMNEFPPSVDSENKGNLKKKTKKTNEDKNS